MSEMNAEIRAAIDFMSEHELEMPHLSPELQRCVNTLRADLVSGGTPVATGTGKAIKGAMYMEHEGKVVRMTAFEVGLIFGRMIEQDKLAKAG